MSKHSDRIWRTVVVAGAMLGAPLVAADTAKGKPAPPAKPAGKESMPKPPDTVESVQRELLEIDKSIKTATEAASAAKTDADRKAAKAKLEAHTKTKAALETKLADLVKARPVPNTPLGKLEKELADHQVKIAAANEAVAASRNEADRSAAKAKLTALQKERVSIENKIAVEKQRLARPRTPESDKPIGRGFILS